MFTATVERSEDIVVGLDVDDEPLWVEVEPEGWLPACLYCGGPCEHPTSHVRADFGFERLRLRETSASRAMRRSQ